MSEHIDKARLDTDLRYRFTYVSKFVNFTTDDIAALNKFAKVANPFIHSVSDTIYQKLLAYDITRNHFVDHDDDSKSGSPVDASHLTLESEQMLFRIHSIRKYLCRILRQPLWNDAFLEYLSNVGKIHTNMLGKRSLNVDYIHINALFGYLEHSFMDAVLANDEIDDAMKKDMIIAISKLFWIQNDFFTMNYIIASQNE
uniref:Globin-sensor domain-containing protein n=1 Tax=Philodina roseola TaxID=96448 RepID=B3G4N6_PHIRO|nr:hypothetical protein [Philodina roseola]